MQLDKKLIGHKFNAFTTTVEAGKIRLFCKAIGEDDPIYVDEEAAKKAGEVTEDAAQKTAKETKNVGKTVEGAVTPDLKSVRCKDGTVQTGKTDTDACRRHLGVKR